MSASVDVVEVMARAWFDTRQSQRMDAGRISTAPPLLRQWDDVTEDDKRGYRAIFEPLAAALDAAGLLATAQRDPGSTS